MTLQEKVNRLDVLGITWMGPDEKYQMADGQYYELQDIDPMSDEQFEVFIQQLIPNIPTVIDRSMAVIQKASGVLRKAEGRRAKAEGIGTKILGDWDSAYAIADPVKRFETLALVDTRSNNFLVNCRTAVTEMKDDRSAMTQLMDKIKTLFTTQENALDVKMGEVPKKVQTRRDQFVKDLAVEKKRLADEADRKAKRAQQEVDLRAWFKQCAGRRLVEYQANVKAKWLKAFNETTLDNFTEKQAGLESIKTVFPSAKIAEIVKTTEGMPICPLLTPEDKLTILDEEFAGYDFMTFQLKYGEEMASYKKELQDKFPSKKEELLEAKRLADKAEADRLAEEERQRDAETGRQKKLKEQQDENARAALQRQQDQERQAESDRLQKIKDDAAADQKKLDDDRIQRENEQSLKLQQETQQQTEQVDQSANIYRASGHAATLFTQATEVAGIGSAPRSRTGYEIKILNRVGWVEIITFWMTRFAGDLPLDKFEKKTVGAMKKDIETLALKAEKDGKVDKIVSAHLSYEPTYSATNVKEKEDKK